MWAARLGQGSRALARAAATPTPRTAASRLLGASRPQRASAVWLSALPSFGAEHRRCFATDGPVLASPSEIKAALQGGGALVDLRGPDEVAAQPSPEGAASWDFNKDASIPVGSLPADKSTPVVLF